MSNSEEMLTAIVNGELIVDEPTCRKEQYLKAIANNEGTTDLPEPNCREEKLLFQIAEKGLGSGENIDAELVEQEAKLTKLETEVNSLTDKPTDMLQQLVDNNDSSYYQNSCFKLFTDYKGNNLDFIGGLDTSQVTNMSQMFYHCENVKSINTSNFDTRNVTLMETMFDGCEALTNLDVSSFNTSKVTSMYSMFSSCKALTSLDLSNFDTSNVTNMSIMFASCSNLTTLDLSNFNTSKVTRMGTMFSSCKALTSLDLSNFDTSNVDSMSYMFNECNKLTNLDVSNFNTSNVTDMSSMFKNCWLLPTLDLSSFDTSNVTNMSSMFQSCGGLTNIIGKLNLIKVTSLSSMFYYNTNLTNVTLSNIKKSLQIGSGTTWGHLLTNESLINTIKELWDLTGSTSQTLTLSTTSKENIANIYVKLVDVTDEMLAEDQYAANKKPCVVCESTDEGAMTLTEYATSKNWAIA